MKTFVPETFLKKVRETDDSEFLQAVEMGYARRFAAEEGNLSTEEFRKFLAFLEDEPGTRRHSREELLFYARNAGVMAEILAGSEKNAISRASLKDRIRWTKGMKRRRIL